MIKRRHRLLSMALTAVLAITLAACGTNKVPAKYAEVYKWPVHDMNRPVPPVVTPGTFSTPNQPGQPPSDAIVLFDGKDLSQWADAKGGPAKWKVENGYFEVVKGTGQMYTKQRFGDVQLHIEWQAPPPAGTSQGRSNSGVFFMNDYEVQVLDVFDNRTYADGMATALYGQYPPMVNAARKPGEWQVYDIIFQRPRFDAKGKVTQPARVTVFWNGVMTQHASELVGPTAHKARPPYKQHEDRLPISLQDHGNPVRFRNVWIRDLETIHPVQLPQTDAAH